MERRKHITFYMRPTFSTNLQISRAVFCVLARLIERFDIKVRPVVENQPD